MTAILIHLLRYSRIAVLCLALVSAGFPAVRMDAEVSDIQESDTNGTRGEETHSEDGNPVSRDELRAGMNAYFGPGPSAGEIVGPDLEILEKRDMGDHERWHLRYNVARDEKAYAYLLVPIPVPEGKRLPLALCPHPTALIGKDRVVGEYEEPAGSDREQAAREARQYALDLVRRGFVAFAPDRAGFGERRLLPGNASVREQMNAYSDYLGERWPGWRLTAGKNVWDLQRAVDFLTEMDFIDPDRIASIGHSLGSWDSIMLAAMDDRVKALVANSGGMVAFRPELWEEPDELRAFLDAGGTGLRGNVNAFLMLIAPRPMLYGWSLDDSYETGGDTILEGLRTVHAYYNQQYDGSDPYWKPPFSIFYHDRGHDFPPEGRALAYAWLERQLGVESER